MQDHLPVIEQREAVGHAVRAGYLYSGMADVAALTGDQAYIDALDAIWTNVVSRRMFLTGGIGSRHHGEAFGDDYELPNAAAYAETCAAIANTLWNHRMFLLHGDAKYLDVLERTLYNGFLAGISLAGDTFFYANPLSSDGEWPFNVNTGAERYPWFDCSCCPTNVVRLLPSLPGYVYAHRGGDIYVNLYAAGTATIPTSAGSVTLVQKTEYPWSGAVRLTVDPDREAEFALRLRVPGWARSEPVPSDLYRYLDAAGEGALPARERRPHRRGTGPGVRRGSPALAPRRHGRAGPADAGTPRREPRGRDRQPRARRRRARPAGVLRRGDRQRRQGAGTDPARRRRAHRRARPRPARRSHHNPRRRHRPHPLLRLVPPRRRRNDRLVAAPLTERALAFGDAIRDLLDPKLRGGAGRMGGGRRGAPGTRSIRKTRRKLAAGADR